MFLEYTLYSEESKGQYGADFHLGTTRVLFALSENNLEITLQISLGGGTSQLSSCDQITLNASTAYVPGHHHLELNLRHFLL